MKYLKLSSQIFSKLKQQVGKSDVKLKHCSKPLETTSVGTSLQTPHDTFSHLSACSKSSNQH